VFSIGFALTRSRSLLRRLLTEHAPDDARQELAERAVTHLEESWVRAGRRSQSAEETPAARPHGTLGE
jgi:hypothetical protein